MAEILDHKTKVYYFKRFSSLSVKRLSVLNTVANSTNTIIKTYLESYAEELEQQKTDDKIYFNLPTYE